MKSLGNIFDSVKAIVDSNTVAITENMKNIDKCAQLQKTTDPYVRKELFEIREENSNLQESIIELKSRSMRDNLVFSGIHEERGENTEEILQEFIKRNSALTTTFPLNGSIAWEGGRSITYIPGILWQSSPTSKRERADPDACPKEIKGIQCVGQ